MYLCSMVLPAASAAVSAAGVRGSHRRLGAVRLSREVSRGLSVAFFLGSGGPNCFRFRQIPELLGPNGFNGFSPVDARPEAWRAATRGAERGERGAGEREEQRREEKGRKERRLRPPRGWRAGTGPGESRAPRVL